MTSKSINFQKTKLSRANSTAGSQKFNPFKSTQNIARQSIENIYDKTQKSSIMSRGSNKSAKSGKKRSVSVKKSRFTNNTISFENKKR